MKIAILADSHDNVPNLEKALGWINKQGISLIIHCGDLCAPSMLTRVLVPNFSASSGKGEIHLVHGNVGDPELLEGVAKKFRNVKVHGQVGEITLKKEPPLEKGEKDEVEIAFTHFPEKAKELAKTGKYDLVFYGHNHKPWMEKAQTNAKKDADKRRKSQRKSASSPRKSAQVRLKSALLVNPGTLAGMFYKATFATYDTKTGQLELKILERL